MTQQHSNPKKHFLFLIFFISFQSLQTPGPGCFLAQARPFKLALASLDLKVPGPSFLPPFLLITSSFVTEYYALTSFYLISERLETLTHTGVEDRSLFHGLFVHCLSSPTKCKLHKCRYFVLFPAIFSRTMPVHDILKGSIKISINYTNEQNGWY